MVNAFHLDNILIEQPLDRYKDLNLNKVQLILSRSNETYTLINRLLPSFASLETEHIRFVCALNALPVNILSTDLEMGEFEDLKGSHLTVNVAAFEIQLII